MSEPSLALVTYVRDLVATALAVPTRHTEITHREQRRALFLVVTAPGAVSTAAFAAGFAVAGSSRAGVLLAIHAFLMVGCSAVMATTRRLDDVVMVGFSIVNTVLPIGVSLSVGGIVASGAIASWSFLSTMFILVAYGRRVAAWLSAVFAFLLTADIAVAVSGVVPPALSPQASAILLGVNLLVTLGYTIVGLAYFIYQRDVAYDLLAEEQDRSERLLLNVLPEPIAARLKAGEATIANHHDNASVLFADVAGFTPLSQAMAPAALVEMLNDVFTRFDALVDAHGLEKIKTIGDSYMVAAGVPEARSDHATVLCDLALEMLALTRDRTFRGHRLTFRIGIHSGPVVAGVIGRRKFIYDLWGDTVNTAARMESFGLPGAVQVTDATRALVDGLFDVEPRGPIEVKGKGVMDVHLVRGRRDPATTDEARVTPIP
jgi:adenylate cyclase